MKHLIIVLLFAFVFYGCGSAYHAMESGTGFTDGVTPVGTYLVTFTGEMKTTEAQVREYALWHCAEITVAKGASFFEVVNERSSKAVEKKEYQTPNGYGFASGSYTNTTEAYTVSLEIKMLTTKPPKLTHPFYYATGMITMIRH